MLTSSRNLAFNNITFIDEDAFVNLTSLTFLFVIRHSTLNASNSFPLMIDIFSNCSFQCCWVNLKTLLAYNSDMRSNLLPSIGLELSPLVSMSILFDCVQYISHVRLLSGNKISTLAPGSLFLPSLTSMFVAMSSSQLTWFQKFDE